MTRNRKHSMQKNTYRFVKNQLIVVCISVLSTLWMVSPLPSNSSREQIRGEQQADSHRLVSRCSHHYPPHRLECNVNYTS